MEKLTPDDRDVERLLITSPKDEQEMLDRDRGLLIVSVSGMRSWATGLGGSNREVRQCYDLTPYLAFQQGS